MSFTTFPILKTERLTLRKLSIDDQNDILTLRSDPKINKYLDRQPCKTIEDAIKFINQINENSKKNSSLYWVISLTEAKTFVGTICLFDFSYQKNSCEIGFELITKFHGQGIMKEALHEVISYVFQILKFKRIVACTHNKNLNSTKLLLKFNFVKSPENNEVNTELIRYNLTQDK